MTSTKVKSCALWYEKNQGEGKITEDMEALCARFVAQWREGHPEPPPPGADMLDESEVLGGVLGEAEA